MTVAGSGEPPTRPRKPWQFWLRLTLGLGILAIILARVDLSALTIRWTQRASIGVVLAIILLASAQALSAWRWKVLIGAAAPPWRYLYRLYLTGAFFSLFLPTSVGGDAVRAVAVTQAIPDTGRAVGSVLLDRIVGMLALVLYTLLGLAVLPGLMTSLGNRLQWKLPPWALAVGLLGLVLVALAAYRWRTRLGKLGTVLQGIWSTLQTLLRDPARCAAALALGLVVQAVYIGVWYTLSSALALPVPGLALLIMVPIVSLSAMAPVTFSGIGIREGVWVLLLGQFGIVAADALGFSLLYFACWIVVAGFGGVLFALKGTRLPDDRPPIALTNEAGSGQS
ncbi:MAG: lysylphosphatidylglycerol synthase transmembrane domain-containing protein [Gemmatimonadota bacterium]